MNKKKKHTFEEMDKINDQLIKENPNVANREEELMRLATKLMSTQQFQRSIEMYKQLAAEFPDKKSLYLSQVGVGYFFLNELEQAIAYYVLAYEQGFDAEMSDDNIWEACEALFKANGNTESLQKYLTLFPKGKYRASAEKLLK